MPKISVITRTRERPALLERAGQSLAQQTFRDFVWVVANDSPDMAGIDAAVQAARAAGMELRTCGVVDSRGMESASNQALDLVDTDYVTFLDDDDTWEPSFLEKTVSLLEAHPRYGGVCTQTSIVEETSDAVPTTLRKYVMNADQQAIQLADMMLFNHLTTNSLVYRRSIHDKLGLYREDLPVMGDWEFGIRLVRACDIAMIPEPLANYHRRVAGEDPTHPYANTVISRVNLHAETDARLRNELLRQEWAAGKIGPGHLMALARIGLRTDQLNRFNFHESQDNVVRRLGGDAEENGVSLASLERRLSALGDRLDHVSAETSRARDEMRERLSPRRWLRRLFGRSG